ncbi:hypothetical protein PFISCL1PPCAC_1941 [Pristionchus fissidentatus]|uniref:Uncharacterized protein n=1 Tax=Pristionchus fissidentatus TaxID=1538716 RepID=A0AAV5UY41_9BILA|nr:hypothetical protein PFISCL1PPCAC_1941 [Pristionchus fissidentatus]
MSSRDRTGRGRSRWNDDEMDISNSDDERNSRAQASVREGILFEHSNYYQFVIKWTSEMSTKNPARQKDMVEKITQATKVERDRINLPEHEKKNVLHCDITIKGLPPSVFFGSGYGLERKAAYFAAAKDLMDKSLKMGLITRDLHEAIGSKPVLEMNRRLPDFMRAVDVVVHLDTRICQAKWMDNVETKRGLSPMDFALLDGMIAESREMLYGADAPVYDSSFCGLCKRKSHLETCPYGIEETRLANLRRMAENRDSDRDRRDGRRRSRSRDRGRDLAREQKEAERLDIERKILAQREALMHEEEERKLKEATERARAAALAFGGGGIPMMGGPGAAPLVTPGLSGAANPMEMMMNHPSAPFMHPFHPMNNPHMGPSPEMMASMAQYAPMMDPMGGGYVRPTMPHRDPVSVPTGYAAHVAALEEQRVRAASEEMVRAKEREEDERRERAESALRAELERRLNEEIEQKRRDLEEELKQRLAPREVRRMGGDMGAVMNAYGVNPVSVPQQMNPYGGGPGGMEMGNQMGMSGQMQQQMQQQPSASPYGQPSPYGMQGSMGSNGLGAPLNPYAVNWKETPEYDEVRRIVNENADTLKNLAFSRDTSIATHPVLTRLSMFTQDTNMDQMSLRGLATDLKDFLAMLKKKAEDGRKRPPEMMLDRGPPPEVRGMERERKEEDRRRRRSRSRSRSRDRRDDRRRGGREKDRYDGRREESGRTRETQPVEIEQEEVIVQVGSSRFRQLRAKEAMQLKKDDLVVAQDLKNGRWSTAKVVRVGSDNRVQLMVGNAQWKKEFNEVYRPIT